MELNDRKKNILKSIIDAYITTGEPVGSKYLSANSQYPLSSATIRNEMSDLEEMGFLEQPHSSSGRVPTSHGYKTYVNSLMEEYKLSYEELKLLNELTQFKLAQIGEIEKLMERASRVISEMTNYTSFSIYKGSDNDADRFECLLIDEYSFLLVMICKNGAIRNRHVKLKKEIDSDTLRLLNNALNAAFSGLSNEKIDLSVVIKFEELLGDYSYLAHPVLRVIHEMTDAVDSAKIHIEGATKFLEYPEFNSISKARGMFEMLEERQKFTKLLSDNKTLQPNVFIGEDFDGSLIPDSSFVVQPVTVDGKTVGAIGVIGPKRMHYKKVLASLEYFARGLIEEFSGDADLNIDNIKK